MLSDGLDSSTITATVLDSSNAVVSNSTVVFSATGGELTSASGVTDTTGKVVVDFSAGTTGFNGTETITATLSGLTPAITRQLPIQILGTTTSLVANNVNITDDGVIKDVLAVTVKNAGNAPLYNVPVTITQAGTGVVTLTQSATNTDVNGKVSVDVVGTTAGNVTLTVTAAGAISTQDYTVSVTGTAFGISTPSVDVYAMAVGDAYTLTVNAPGVTTVVFASTVGTLTGVNPVAGPANVITQTVAAGTASSTLTSAGVGIATVQVYDQNNITTQDFTQIAISQPLSATALIRVQTSVAVVAKSTATLKNTATITATVTDNFNQPIGNAPVFFSIPGIANGASLSPVLVFSDSNGVAQTTFTSGGLSSGAQGINVFAEAIGFPAVKKSANIIVGTTPGSLSIGHGTKVIVPNTTEYELPMSVIVTDSSGAAVPGAVVSLQVWPSAYRTGYWYNHNQFHGVNTLIYFEPCVTGFFANEDINKNLILDAGEDISHSVPRSLCDASVANHGVLDALSAGIVYPINTQLDPPQAAAGSLPQTVVADQNGIANFNLTYLKGSAVWIDAIITAKTLVLGTESSSSISFTLPYVGSEGVAGELPASAFGQ
ncbi:MAG: Ig-like domain-containing protein [Ghiorsea sp.]